MSFWCNLGFHNWVRGKDKTIDSHGTLAYLRKCTRCGLLHGVVPGYPRIIDTAPPTWNEFYDS